MRRGLHNTRFSVREALGDLFEMFVALAVVALAIAVFPAAGTVAGLAVSASLCALAYYLAGVPGSSARRPETGKLSVVRGRGARAA